MNAPAESVSAPTADFTVVTACDRNYFWGQWLLIASLRYERNPVLVHAGGLGLTDGEWQLLAQFGNVRPVRLSPDDPRYLTLRKPEVLLTAQTEYVGWFDSDTFVIGDITKYWRPPNGEFQCRFRAPEELANLYRGRYAPEDQPGTIPARVRAIWQADVGERRECAIQSACLADNFTFHRRHLDFIRRWDAQMRKVLPAATPPFAPQRSLAYHLLDEPVLNSLLAFAAHPPPVAGAFLLDQDPQAFVLHFGMSPKPWQRWNYRHLPYYDRVLRVIEWAQAQGFQTPPLPPSLRRRYRLVTWTRAWLEHGYRGSRSLARRVLKGE
jgi:hypothetical protein